MHAAAVSTAASNMPWDRCTRLNPPAVLTHPNTLAVISSMDVCSVRDLFAGAESGRAAPSAAIPADTLDEEFELVKNAFFTLPEDQSGWLYHRWLLSNAMAAAQAARGSPKVWAKSC